MILYPAIDLKAGACVRLLRGDMDRATTYARDPAVQARSFQDAGCEWLHVVDLDGAFAGRSANAEAVDAILAAVSVPVQLGGGLRDRAAIDRWLAAGVARVVLGTAAVEDPALVREAARAHPDRIAVGLDARAGRVAIRGWAEATEIDVLDLARRFEDAGIAAIVHTDIERDGAMSGPDVAATEAIARAVRVPVIASGGVSSLADLVRLRDTGVVAGAITGRALYDGSIDLATALRAIRAAPVL